MTRNAMLRDIFYKLWTEKDFKIAFKETWPQEYEALYNGYHLLDEEIALIWHWMQEWKGE